MAKSKSTATASEPSAEKLADFVAFSGRIGKFLTMDQRKAIIESMANPVREAESKPSPYEPGKMYRFRVVNGDVEDEVTAANEDEAWSAMCDKVKRWPGRPRPGNVTCIGGVTEVDSPIADLPPATNGGEQVKATNTPDNDLGL
jgi:hypothetical protein